MSRIKANMWSRIGVFVFAISIIMSSAARPVSALTEKEYNLYWQNSIFFYDPYEEGGDGEDEEEEKECRVTSNGNTNYAGDTVWSDAELATIAENQSIYEEAANEYGFPWQVLAVLHSIETALRRYNPANGQGVYQLYSYTDGGTNENRFEPASSISEDEFRRQTKIAAEVVSSMVGDLNDSNNVKKLFFRYNGVSSKYIQKAINMGFTSEQASNGEGSVYVMNRYDAQRDPTSSEMSSYWPGRYTSDGEYDPDSTTTVFGSYVKYEALYGSITCEPDTDDDSSSGEGTGDLEALVKAWVWPTYRGKDDNRKQAYADYMDTKATYKGDCKGVDCGAFVANIIKASGWDVNYPQGSTSTQNLWLRSNWKKVSVNNLRLGDVGIKPGHVILYIGNIPGFQTKTASASQCTRAPMSGSPNENLNQYTWYRKR